MRSDSFTLVAAALPLRLDQRSIVQWPLVHANDGDPAARRHAPPGAVLAAVARGLLLLVAGLATACGGPRDDAPPPGLSFRDELSIR